MVDVVKQSSIIEEEEQRALQLLGRRVSFGRVLLLLLVVLFIPALYRPTASGKLPYDDHFLADLNAVKPDYVFIGNSMLRTRIDESVLTQHMGDHCCYVLWTVGAESAWMHQALKNVVLAADHRPKKTFIFYRDAYLTQPTFRATDRYWWRIEQFSHEQEPQLDRAMAASRSWQEKLEYELGRLYPLQKKREQANYAVSWLTSQLTSPGTVRFGQPTAEKFNDLFALEKLRSIETADDASVDNSNVDMYDFDKHVEGSLLPSMLKMAKDAGVELVFVRVQRRPTENGPPLQRPELQAYTRKLQLYLLAHGAKFYDFNGDPELTLDHYLDGDHIRPEWRPRSTELFLQRLQKYFL